MFLSPSVDTIACVYPNRLALRKLNWSEFAARKSIMHFAKGFRQVALSLQQTERPVEERLV